MITMLFSWSRDSDSLRAGRSGDRIPVGARFSAPVQIGPGGHPASCTMGTGSFPWVKRPRRGVDHPPQSSAEVKERVELYSPSWSSWLVLGWTLSFTFTLISCPAFIIKNLVTLHTVNVPTSCKKSCRRC